LNFECTRINDCCEKLRRTGAEDLGTSSPSSNPVVEEFTEFNDLEDEDHDGDDDEERRTSWGPEDDGDENDDL
jgi:hypothetical protein